VRRDGCLHTADKDPTRPSTSTFLHRDDARRPDSSVVSSSVWSRHEPSELLGADEQHGHTCTPDCLPSMPTGRRSPTLRAHNACSGYRSPSDIAATDRRLAPSHERGVGGVCSVAGAKCVLRRGQWSWPDRREMLRALLVGSFRRSCRRVLRGGGLGRPRLAQR
jgi:hypothetical protein